MSDEYKVKITIVFEGGINLEINGECFTEELRDLRNDFQHKLTRFYNCFGFNIDLSKILYYQILTKRIVKK